MCVKCILKGMKEKHPRQKFEEITEMANRLFKARMPPEVEARVKEIETLLPDKSSPDFWDGFWHGAMAGGDKESLVHLLFAVQRREKECLANAEVNDFDHCEVNIHD